MIMCLVVGLVKRKAEERRTFAQFLCLNLDAINRVCAQKFAQKLFAIIETTGFGPLCRNKDMQLEELMKRGVTWSLLSNLWGLLLVSLLASPACILSNDENKAVGNVFGDPPLAPPPIINHPADKPFCRSQKFNQPQALITKKVDVLFVVDSSGSLAQERREVGEGIDALIGALPVDVDYHIGVMLAHVGIWSGQLYRFDPFTPLVLKSSEYPVLDDLRFELSRRMRNTPAEIETGTEQNITHKLPKWHE
mgnify:CR=1 FL=1